MSPTNNNSDNTPASSIQEEGEKVTGGDETASENATSADAANTDNTASQEAAPHEESKKEDISGYNELPDQVKVGGG